MCSCHMLARNHACTRYASIQTITRVLIGWELVGGGESANEFPDFPRGGTHPKTSYCCTTVGVCKNTVANPRIAYRKHRCWPRPSPRPIACFKMRAEWRSQLLENHLTQNALPTPRPDKSFGRDQDTAQTGDARTIQNQCISAGLGRRNRPNKK